MKFEVCEISDEWLQGKEGIVGKVLEVIEAPDLVAAIRTAQSNYPNVSLRISGDGYSIEFAGGGELNSMDEQKIYQALEEKA